jgi:chemotaxis protein histidine kinase CheA
VFTEIFEEEIQGDLNILKRTVNELKAPVDQNILRNIMNACTSIQSSAQLFNYDQIDEFTTFVSGIIEDLLSGDAGFSDRLIEMLKGIPGLIEQVVKNDEADMQGYIEELTTVIEESNNDHHDDIQSNIANDELIVDQEDLKNKLKMELN